MTAERSGIAALLEEEAAAWRSLAPADYDAALCLLVDRSAGQETAVLLALAGAGLARGHPGLTESRLCIAERVLETLEEADGPSTEGRAHALFTSAWRQLCAAVESGPDVMAMSPGIPAGAGLPHGADPAAIVDPALREQAAVAASEHEAAAERWNAKQRAIGHLQRLAERLRREGARDARVRALADEVLQPDSLPRAVHGLLAARE